MEKQTGRLTRVKGRKGDMPVHGTENKHEIQTDKAIGAEGSNTEDLTSATDPLLQKLPDTWVKREGWQDIAISLGKAKAARMEWEGTWYPTSSLI